MPNKHKHSPMSVRLPGPLRVWVEGYARRAGLPVSQVIVQALGAFARSTIELTRQAVEDDSQDNGALSGSTSLPATQ